MARRDGRRLRSLEPMVQIVPHLFERRTDAQVLVRQVVLAEPVNRYLAEQRELGRRLTWTDVLVAACVRTLAERPRLNRFVLNDRLHARHGISVAFIVRRSRETDAGETSVKVSFAGTEGLLQVAEAVHATVAAAATGRSDAAAGLARTFTSLPAPVTSALMGGLRALDRHGLLPGALTEVSPFHASVFLTQLRSIGCEAVHHHLWNIGTAGFFVALGREKDVVVAESGAPVVRRGCEIAITLDERLCDGRYFSDSLARFADLMGDPRLLEQPLPGVTPDVP